MIGKVSKARMVGLRAMELNSWSACVYNHSNLAMFIIEDGQTDYVYTNCLNNNMFIVGLNRYLNILDIFTRKNKKISLDFDKYTVLDLFPSVNLEGFNYNHILIINNITHELQLINDDGIIVAKIIIDIPDDYEFEEYIDSICMVNVDGTLRVYQYTENLEVRNLIELDKQGKVEVYGV